MIQLFFRSSGELAYGRARHYIGKTNGKSKFEYHPQSMEFLKTLLKAQTISVPTEKSIDGQIGQKPNGDLLKSETDLEQQNSCARDCPSLVGGRPAKSVVERPRGFKSHIPRQFPHYRAEGIFNLAFTS